MLWFRMLHCWQLCLRGLWSQEALRWAQAASWALESPLCRRQGWPCGAECSWDLPGVLLTSWNLWYTLPPVLPWSILRGESCWAEALLHGGTVCPTPPAHTAALLTGSFGDTCVFISTCDDESLHSLSGKASLLPSPGPRWQTIFPRKGTEPVRFTGSDSVQCLRTPA